MVRATGNNAAWGVSRGRARLEHALVQWEMSLLLCTAAAAARKTTPYGFQC